MMFTPSGKKVMHSKATPMTSSAPARMPKAQPKAKMNPPTDHKCKVCPGASRK
jgi:hypothetical protein